MSRAVSSASGRSGQPNGSPGAASADAQLRDALAAAARLPAGPCVGGEWPDGEGETIEVRNPATGAVFARVRGAGAAEVDEAVRRARSSFASGDWSRLEPSARARVLWRAAELIDEHAAELTLLEVLDNGKPLRDAARIDIPQAAEHFRYQAAAAIRLEGAQLPNPHAAFTVTVSEPRGVVAAITPWNFPLIMAARTLAPALAAGNAVVLKPSEETPLTALRLAQLLYEAGAPPGTLSVLPGLGETTGRALVGHPDVDQVAFTGGSETAREIVRGSADDFKRLTLELGGKSPAIVLADARLDAAVPSVLHGAFSNQGQNCCAVTRVIAHESIADELRERLVEGARALRVGPGFEAQTELGPLISAGHRDGVERAIAAARAEGARVLTGGGRPDAPGFFLTPAVLDGVEHGSALAQNEVFGPVVFLQTFGDPSEAVALANATRYGLAAGVFTGDVAAAQRVIRELEVGTVWINVYERFSAGVPFAGRKQSGYGHGVGGHAALEEFTATKTVWVAA